jgi:hypothetical protein
MRSLSPGSAVDDRGVGLSRRQTWPHSRHENRGYGDAASGKGSRSVTRDRHSGHVGPVDSIGGIRDEQYYEWNDTGSVGFLTPNLEMRANRQILEKAARDGSGQLPTLSARTLDL